jgi:site-specific recombinase XerD
MPAVQLPLFGMDDSGAGRAEPAQDRRKLNGHSSLADAVDRFEPAMRLKGFTQNTINSFTDDLRLVLRYLGPNHPVAQIGQQHLTDFMEYLLKGRGKPCNAKSYARRLTTLKVFFAWLVEAEIISADPAAALVHKPVSTPLPQVLSEEDVERIVEAGHQIRMAERPDVRPLFLFRLLMDTGIKKAECMALKLGDVDLSEGGSSSVVVRYSEARNRHKERRLAVAPGFASMLREYRGQYHPQINLFECTHRNLEYVLRDLGKSAGVHKAVSFETIRMSCAVSNFRKGMPPEALRVKLGLSRISWEETSRKIELLASSPL